MTTALYRRYRPDTFADMIGQDHVTEPLMRALDSGRVNHAYLFSGPRGCGKTTSARILARCLNCAQGPTSTPCGECDSCVALARGGAGSVDVIEIDAASNGGVDDARDLRERASYGPANSRYKVYIIDEAHMVTPQGFNALLKIVEEPPEHVKFVFATTEPEKVIGTIRSRTHHYPFRLVPPGVLADYAQSLCDAENVPVEPGVMSFVTRAGGGSVRDSLSVLDQLIAGSGAEGVTYAMAASLLGFTDGELLDAVVDAFAGGDAAAVFRQIDKVVESGSDPRRFVEDLLERLRDLIVVAAVPDGVDQVLRHLPVDQLDRMRQQAAAYGPGGLSRAADIANAGLTEMTGATSPRLQLELIAARILLPASSGEQGYAARLDRLERRMEVGGAPTGDPRASAPTGRPAAAPATEPAPQPSPAQTPADRAQPEPTHVAAPAVPSERPDEQPAPRRTEPSPPAEQVARPQQSEPDPAPEAAPAPAEHAAAPSSPSSSPGGGLDTDAVRRAWPDVLDRIAKIKRVTWTLLSEHAQVVDFDGQRLLLGTSTQGLADAFRRGQHPEVVRQALIDALGLDCTVEARPHDGPPPTPEPDDPPPSGGAGGFGSPSGDSSSGQAAPEAAPERQERPQPRAERQDAPPSNRRGSGSAAAESDPKNEALGEVGGATPPGGWDQQTGAEWGSVAAAGSAPDWATGDASAPVQATTVQSVQPVQAPEQSVAAEVAPPVAVAPADPAESPRRRAERLAAGGHGAGDPAPTPGADDTAVDYNDESIEDAGAVGVPVIQSVFGGTIIAEDED